MNESAFFQDLAVLMAVAGAVTVVFTRFKWPKVIGYLLAGILMSKNTFGGNFLVNEQSIYTIGQLGIVFLMFSLGLEFSAKTFWLWGVLGSFIIVGPFIYTHKFLKSMNLLVDDFNTKGA